MELREKQILYGMVYHNIVIHGVNPRGCGKSIFTILYIYRQKALDITNYILASIGESIKGDEVGWERDY